MAGLVILVEGTKLYMEDLGELSDPLIISFCVSGLCWCHLCEAGVTQSTTLPTYSRVWDAFLTDLFLR